MFPISDKKRFLEVKVIPSYKCAKKCPYCYNRDLNNNRYPTNKEKLISTIKNVIQIPAKSRLVEIIGGEPLSNSSYFLTKEIIQTIRQTSPDTKIIIQSGLFGMKHIEAIFPIIDGFSYSVDVSVMPKSKNVRNLKHISALSVQYGVPVQLQTVLSMDDSLTDIVRFLDYCDNLNYNWIGIGYPECMPYTPKDLDIQVWIYANLLNMSSRWQNIILGGAILESIHDYMSGVIYNTSCMCGECSITIQPDGTLTPCYHYRVNEISSVDSISSIKRIREDMLKNTTCVDCDYWGICHGGCLLGGLYHNNNHFTKDPAFCYVLKNLVTKCISVKKL